MSITSTTTTNATDDTISRLLEQTDADRLAAVTPHRRSWAWAGASAGGA